MVETLNSDGNIALPEGDLSIQQIIAKNFQAIYSHDLDSISTTPLRGRLDSPEIMELWEITKDIFSDRKEEVEEMFIPTIRKEYTNHCILEHLIRGYVEFKAQRYEKVDEIFEHILQTDKQHPLMGYVYFYKAAKCINDGEQILSFNLLTKAIPFFEKYNNSIFMMKLYNNMGLFHLSQREYEKASEYFNMGRQYSTMHKDSPSFASIVYNLGYTHRMLLDNKLSEMYLKQAISLYQSLGDINLCGWSHTNLGIIYGNQGYLDKSEDEFNNALQCFEKTNNEQYVGRAYNNLGLTSLKLGKLTQARERFVKGYQIMSKYEDPQIPRVLYNLYNLGIQSKKFDPLEYFEKLQEYSKDGYAMLARAKEHSKTGRIRDTAIALGILEDIVKSDESTEVKVIALFELTTLLVNEFKASGNVEIILEIQDLISELYNIAKLQNSKWIIVQADLLQSQLELLKQNVTRSMSLLSRAKETSQRFGFSYLELLITREQDRIATLVSSDKSSLTTVGTESINEVLSSMLFQNYERVMVDHESPILFQILHHGVSVFSKVFDDSLGVQEELIGSFLTGINDFLNEILKSEYPFDIIQQKNHTILFRSLDDFGFSYVFKGSSYYAQKKLDKFLKRVSEDRELMDDFYNNLSVGLVTHETNKKLSSMVEEVFIFPREIV